MDVDSNQPIATLVQLYRQRDLSRSGFMAILAGIGASAGGIATLLASVDASAAGQSSTRTRTHHRNKKQHNQHLRHQAGATRPHGDGRISSSPASGSDSIGSRQAQHLQALLDDYAENAVVEDPLFAEPFVGRQAIAQRKQAEMQSMSGVTIDVVHRFSHQDQLVAEWIVRGTHEGDFMGFAGTGRRIEIRGMTVVTRKAGKVTKESLYYDVADVRRQLG
jgi:steroid delta-isomerase-like uncharacterized protein